MNNNLEKVELVQNVIKMISTGDLNKKYINELLKLLRADTCEGKVYKYRPANTDFIESLKEGFLYCSSPSKFNDPFDCKIGLDISACILEKLEGFIGNIVEQGNKFEIGDINLQNAVRALNNYIMNDKSCATEDNKYSSGIVEIMIRIALSLFGDGKDLTIEQKNQVYKILEKISSKQVANNEIWNEIMGIMGITTDADEITQLCLAEKKYNLKLDGINDNEQIIGDAICSFEKKMDEICHVGCLSTDYKNQLMWSHYADGHKGFCVEYDFNKASDFLEKYLFLPVIYSEERVHFPSNILFPAYSLGGEQEEKNTMIRSLVTKDKVWSYEKEWRVIVFSSKESVKVKMPPISCIYIGALCENKQKQELIKIAKELNIPVKQMVVDRGKYMLHVSDI